MALWVAGSKSDPLSLSLSSTGARGAQGRCRKRSQRSATTVWLLPLSTMPEVEDTLVCTSSPFPSRCSLLFNAASELSVSTISFLFLAISCFAMIFTFYYMKWVLYLPLIWGSFEEMTDSGVFFPQFRLSQLAGDHAHGGL